ncbi:helix-turn-helix domain-containing protein [Nakamurella sp. PAMC28650]|nr:helix-turn-helix domain-containing protein [Nakamurella sp. PAMC28650]
MKPNVFYVGGDISIADAAAATGFADQSHFARRFKLIVGRTPSEFKTSRP